MLSVVVSVLKECSSPFPKTAIEKALMVWSKFKSTEQRPGWQESIRPRNFVICVNSFHIRSYSGPHFPTFRLNTEKYQSECRKMQTRITPNTDTFYAVFL